MFSSKDKLIAGGIVIESGEKIPYRVVAHYVNFSHLDPYVVVILNVNTSPDQVFQKVSEMIR
jgi:hypothetical protein